MRILNTICSAIRNKLRLFFHTQKTDSGCDVIAIFLAIITLAYPAPLAYKQAHMACSAGGDDHTVLYQFYQGTDVGATR